jgi:hypothetical protein
MSFGSKSPGGSRHLGQRKVEKSGQRKDQLNVWVVFVDADGKVLEKKSIYNSGFRSGTSKRRPQKGTIEKTFEMPLETTHIAFQSSWQLRLGR